DCRGVKGRWCVVQDSDQIQSARSSKAGAPSSSHPPRIRHDCLVRERLLRQLDKGVDGALTLVTAPAGFGKSTLLAQWAEGAPMPVARVNARERHADSQALFGATTAVVVVVAAVFGDSRDRRLGPVADDRSQLPA